jgi:hypothetical protein
MLNLPEPISSPDYENQLRMLERDKHEDVFLYSDKLSIMSHIYNIRNEVCGIYSNDFPDDEKTRAHLKMVREKIAALPKAK